MQRTKHVIHTTDPQQLNEFTKSEMERRSSSFLSFLLFRIALTEAKGLGFVSIMLGVHCRLHKLGARLGPLTSDRRPPFEPQKKRVVFATRRRFHLVEPACARSQIPLKPGGQRSRTRRQVPLAKSQLTPWTELALARRGRFVFFMPATRGNGAYFLRSIVLRRPQHSPKIAPVRQQRVWISEHAKRTPAFFRHRKQRKHG